MGSESPTLADDTKASVKRGVSPTESPAKLFVKLHMDSVYWTLPGSTAGAMSRSHTAGAPGEKDF